MKRPRIAITPDLAEDRCTVARSYSRMVWEAGGLPIIVPVLPDAGAELLEGCDGLILTGGDDPNMEQWGQSTHPKATRIHADRQAFEIELLSLVAQQPEFPVLGVCLGMQLMALHHGGKLEQYLPDTLVTHADHWGKVEHQVEGALGSGVVHSHHRQAIVDPGVMSVVAVAHDNVIEAVRSDDRRFYLGVQWHPERTVDELLSRGLFTQMVHAAG